MHSWKCSNPKEYLPGHVTTISSTTGRVTSNSHQRKILRISTIILASSWRWKKEHKPSRFVSSLGAAKHRKCTTKSHGTKHPTATEMRLPETVNKEKRVFEKTPALPPTPPRCTLPMYTTILYFSLETNTKTNTHTHTA